MTSFQYVPHHQVEDRLKEGWTETTALTGTHHGEHAVLMKIPEDDPFASQVGGSHYKDMAIQPAEYIIKNNIGWAEGCAIAYVSRWRSKGGIEDLRKAIHSIELLIAEETADDRG